MAEPATLSCQVAYARPERQHIIELTLPIGATAQDALTQSGLCELYPEIVAGSVTLGIFGKVVPPEYRLQEADRVEIYRPLAVDPRAARRARVKRSR
jgi:uncharacterized protein